jgi:PAS domain S-box-containing protein
MNTVKYMHDEFQHLFTSIASAPHKPILSYPYREAFELSNDVHIWFDGETKRIVDANDVSSAVLGYSKDELIGSTICILVPKSDLATQVSGWNDISRGNKISDLQIDVVGKSGKSTKMHASTFGISDANNSVDDGCNLVVLRKSASFEAYSHFNLPSASSHASHTLAYEIAATEARERQKIANVLHDEIGQLLAIMALKLSALGTSVSPDELASQIKELLAFIDQAAQATRSATFELSCPLLQHMGLQIAIEGLAQRLTGISGLTIHVTGSLPKMALPEPLGQVLFRVVRELLINILKHAKARDAWIEMVSNGREIEFTIVDNGVGMPSTPRRQFSPDGGYGLFSAEAQMRAIGGRLIFSASNAIGTRVVLTAPISPHVILVDISAIEQNAASSADLTEPIEQASAGLI